MFTGIITHVGEVAEISDNMLVIHTDEDLLARLDKGASVSVNGVCLTVVASDASTFEVEVMPETRKRTMFDYIQHGDLVNLELPATADTLLSGHIVQGHVDTTATVEGIEEDENSSLISFTISKEYAKYIVEKGSITINGISLTVINISENTFSVGIIPHTWDNTMIHNLIPGDVVNIEVDVLAKYIEKQLAHSD